MNFTKTSRLLSLLIVGVGLAVNGFAQSFLTNGLMAYYPFSGNANDESGNGNDGVLHGTSISSTTNQSATPNSALHFGGGSYISVTPTPFNVNSNWTISLWCIIDGTNNGPHYFLSTGEDNQVGINLSYVAYLTGGWGFSSGASGPALLCYATNTATVWTMFTCVRNGDVFKMFLNNVLVNSVHWTGTMLDTGTLWFGRHQTPCCPYDLIGSLSDVRIYNRALSSNEVAQLYSLESTGPASLWKAESNANDSVDGNNGTLINGAGFSSGIVGQAFNFNGVDQYVEVANSSNLNPSASFSIEG
jgi:hypothetical protein